MRVSRTGAYLSHHGLRIPIAFLQDVRKALESDALAQERLQACLQTGM